ncbi:hypothetical protein DFH08DRAFT_870662 [Mycena albidolilacea]|uniref:Uncharacterized protein n=1 Tax=Mycena albidolilacea TaxID=1033008 RepID=A0AAD6ZYQ1_9AGAR|nr:hypothetical protein DFH08DRAFT_870662 [Mycena albidolilacea]
MADGGCARGKIGPMMEHIGAIFGVHIDRAMSRRTVGRAIKEGGVAAKMQLAFELSLNHGTLRLSYLLQLFLATHVPDYAVGKRDVDPQSTPKVRFLGVEKTIDHTSTESIRGWQTRVEEFCDLFNRSPLAQHLAQKYSVREFLRILKGMNGNLEPGGILGRLECEEDSGGRGDCWMERAFRSRTV